MKESEIIMGEDLENQGKVLTRAWIVPFAYGTPKVHGTLVVEKRPGKIPSWVNGVCVEKHTK